ncbi:MAG: molybdopterin molybdenumtransferase MoeA [Cyanobacteria bacterium RYN_339]|nr:molybdopterin molybdenumtransferase MoeA [Cyanobacteria bacterium RYN_339]
MISVEEALTTILARFHPLEAERVPLREAWGRVLAADVVAREAIPPFDNSAMDGYAVRLADCIGATEANPVVLRVLGEAPAGKASGFDVVPGTAVRIMTGAPIPAGADAVVMREETREAPDRVEILVEPEPAEHIRRLGEDVPRGSTVFEAGELLNPAALGVLASIGVAEVDVIRRPRVALLATGDELVPVEAPLAPGQIHDSTGPALEALLTRLGAVPVPLGTARDEIEDLRAKIAEGARHDLLITTGGVSVGDHDLVKVVLGELGEMAFWKVNMQPGKPLAFGAVGDTPVLGLPGNPVSSLVAFELFVRPAVRRMQGHARVQRPRLTVRLSHLLEKRMERRQFVRAWVHVEDGAYQACSTGPQGSHVLTSVARGNALLDLPPGAHRFEAGTLVQAILLEEGEAYAGRHPDR